MTFCSFCGTKLIWLAFPVFWPVWRWQGSPCCARCWDLQRLIIKGKAGNLELAVWIALLAGFAFAIIFFSPIALL